MNEQFICISCWKEFTVDPQDVESRGGKVVCPNCGYIQPLADDIKVATKKRAPQATPKPLPPVQTSAEEELTQREDAVEQLSWSALEESTGGSNSSDPTDEMEDFEEIGMNDERADEKTPLVPLDFDELEEEITSDRAAVPTEWRLKTPSGLTFKFTDPEALFGWKKKLATYRQLEVSPDGERWVDFSQFIESYEEMGDAMKAFLVSEGDDEGVRRLDEEKNSKPTSQSAESVSSSGDSNNGPFPPEPSGPQAIPPTDDDMSPGSVSTTAQFTFKTMEEKSSGFGKYFLLAVLGLAIGAGAVYVMITYM